jgi:heme A synthase
LGARPFGTSRGFGFLALGSALAAWALVAVGGVVRVTASGLGCPHWPLCTAKAIPLDEKESVIEYSHRAVVALVIVLVLVVAILGWLHFVVGMLFLGTVSFAAAAAWRRPGQWVTRRFARLAWGTLLAALALVSLGAAVVAVDADSACGTQWPGCNGSLAAGGGHAELQVAHRMLAYAVAGLALALLVMALRGKGRVSRARCRSSLSSSRSLLGS